ncbi:hypothetical protein DFP73DRAFT_530113 [Morchella snyderi]|nr:hypothetical protein DFP73DRAFT_530113 [Morchella snyderi]
MESRRSRTIVSATITTEPCSGEDATNTEALQDKISDMTQQILLLLSRTDELAQMVRRQEKHGPDVTALNPVDGGVYLGLVRAGDVARLGESMLKELDDGLRVIAKRLFPRRDGITSSGVSAERQAVIALLNKVSLRQDLVPATSINYFADFHDKHRGMYQRAAGARYGYMKQTVEDRTINFIYYETFLQLVLFRGIDLDALS